MKIRWKLLILLLAIALTPTLIAAVLHRVWTHRLGSHLASGSREILTENARRHLQALVDDFRRLVNRDKQSLELALAYQAREVEHRLAASPPRSPRLFFSEDYDEGANLPPGMASSEKHFRAGPDGKLAPIPVTYGQQVYVVAPGVDRKAIADDMARLSTMWKVYEFLHRSNPRFMYWQYTALESGFHTSYPGHGGYPPGYDPRKRLWYDETKKADELTWLPPMVEVSTRTVTLGLAVPVRRPDGSFAGVTAIDVGLAGVFEELKLPEPWSEDASAMLVFPGWPDSETEGKLVILAQKGRQERRRDWETTVEWRFLEADEPPELAALMKDAAAGRSGVRKMGYRGRESLWAHGAGSAEEPFPVVIVPYDRIVAQATEAEQYVLDKIFEGLKITGVILLCVIVAVAVVAYFSSLSVTRPVRELTRAAEKLASGDYQTPVDIRTGDELQELAEIFNHMAPKLHERERMKQSLTLAMEVQQQLLPQEPPKLAGFDIAGKSDYCEETGGDYYDFIDLMEIGPGKLGIAVGDVSGHGIGAALLMASARAVLRSHAVRHGSDLGQLFDTLNRHLVADTGDEQFMTLFYGVLDAGTHSFSWTSGGHDPALWLRRASGQIEELPNTGMPVGVMEEASYGQAGPITLQPADVIVIGTDGIWEAANSAGEVFGKQRLRDLLAASSDQTAHGIRTAVVRSVHEFLEAEPQEDDITLVVIKAL
jgi:sigma-B regulation protein RsbU (phosphoserine phosphatase)